MIDGEYDRPDEAGTGRNRFPALPKPRTRPQNFPRLMMIVLLNSAMCLDRVLIKRQFLVQLLRPNQHHADYLNEASDMKYGTI